MAHIVSIQVGKPQTYTTGTSWTSAIVKSPVLGSVWMGATNIAGDGQADLENHGGADKAVLAYGLAHYDHWRTVMPDVPWINGGFGENLTIDGLTEQDVCIGDVYRIGTARVQVSQPRQPCWKLARRWAINDLTAQVEQTGYTGWYLRVIDEGEIEARMPLDLVERPYPQWSVARTTEVYHRAKRESAFAMTVGAELAQVEPLAESWKSALLYYVNKT